MTYNKNNFYSNYSLEFFLLVGKKHPIRFITEILTSGKMTVWGIRRVLCFWNGWIILEDSYFGGK